MTFPVLREVIPSDVTVEFRAMLCMTMRWACGNNGNEFLQGGSMPDILEQN